VPYFTTLLAYSRKPEMYDLLKELIRLSALPIKQIQDSFICAIDATGMGTFQLNGGWLKFKHGENKEVSFRNWVKLHAVTDTATNIFLSADITIGKANDSPELEHLMNNIDFPISALTGDKAYCSRKNFEIVSNKGATPYLLFKKNALPNKKGSLIWSKCFKLYTEKPQEYLQIYHKRSNIEATFGALKKRFGDTVHAKTLNGQKTEALLKVLLHNLACLIKTYYEQNIELQFSTETPKAPIKIF